MLVAVGTVDQTMPALFAPPSANDDLRPLAQLGAGPDGIAMLAQRGDQLLEVAELNFAPGSARWLALEARVRAISAIEHPGVRAVLGLERDPPRLLMDGDRSPPLAELMEQGSVDLARAMRILGELARAIAAAHHIGIHHGRLDPWSVHVGAGDRPRIELTGLATKPNHHEWARRCVAPELADGPTDEAAADVFAIGALLDLFVTTSSSRPSTTGVMTIIRDTTAADPDTRLTAAALVRKLVGTGTVVGGRTTLDEIVVRVPRGRSPACASAAST
jgi:hypothetical protein